MSSPLVTDSEVMFRGIDGGNLLGFLAAAGAIQLLSAHEKYCDSRLSWKLHGAAYRPILHTTGGDPFAAITEVLGRSGTAGWLDKKKLDFTAEEFREFLRNSSASRHLRDRGSALGAEVVPERNQGDWRRTPLYCLSGQQSFTEACRKLIESTEPRHIRSALTEPWSYSDDGKGMSLRWDPIDDRRYALRWRDPSGDEQRMVRGAYRLAIESLGWFTCLPGTRRVATIAFHRLQSHTAMIWPLWELPVSADVARSMIAHPLLNVFADTETNEKNMNATRTALREMGIVAAYRSSRIKPSDYANFTPAEQML